MFLLISLLIVSACSKLNGEDVTAPDNSGNSGQQNPLDKTETDAGGEIKDKDHDNDGVEELDDPTGKIKDPAMRDYLLPDSSKAHYEGDGNEFAELDVQVSHPYEDYVMIYENNGAAIIRKLYKVEKDRILILEEKHVDVEENAPPVAAIKKMEVTGVYLQKPFEKGATFGKWTVVDTDATVETPYKKFEHAIVIEDKGDTYSNRKYFVEGFGEVKRESVMKVKGKEDLIVTSSMESVTQP
ncbi:hypothetical protein DVB69_10415 [Sporosarcina sp. BI001-red]|uniref:hypothetical protein n=1 Tax=Sporosarcina sp. BI001-red TaxID=2282866 RepID=UPI000E234E3A|nr:hypothetical protein [Sporosarcina sp. BI001-red]REB07252.1 hypothetical protein DVB69_10415 [Sporosarcina sp. BI001-red]